MYDCNARWYDPQLMRFTGRDPVRGGFDEPLSLHRYLYCFNEPVNRLDPTGRTMEDVISGRAGLMLGVAALAVAGMQMQMNAHSLSYGTIIMAVDTGKEQFWKAGQALMNIPALIGEVFAKRKKYGRLEEGEQERKLRDTIDAVRNAYDWNSSPDPRGMDPKWGKGLGVGGAIVLTYVMANEYITEIWDLIFDSNEAEDYNSCPEEQTITNGR